MIEYSRASLSKDLAIEAVGVTWNARGWMQSMANLVGSKWCLFNGASCTSVYQILPICDTLYRG